jgi:hypothetical protein
MSDTELPLKITIGDKYMPAMEITDQAAADVYFARCVDHNLRACEAEGVARTREEAEAQERVNLGYFAGYYAHSTRARVERLFKCAHPIFGPAAEGLPSPEEAFEAGVLLAQRLTPADSSDSSDSSDPS